jgi:hypothetical protein
MGEYLFGSIESEGNKRYTDVSGQNYEPAEHYLNSEYYDEVSKRLCVSLYG